jgi:hypothetical protein
VTNKTTNLLIAISLIAFAAAFRLMPHPANFAPVAAVAIFGGAILPRKVAVWIPLAAMAISDLLIGLHPLIPVTWGCYLLIALASSRWLRKLTFFRGAGLTVGASIFFFTVTNFAVWLQTSMYAHSLSGLAQCYEMALPFFRNTLASDIVYTSVLFAIYALAMSLNSKLIKPQTAKYTA